MLRTGLAGRCPRCGTGPLFRGFLTVVDECEVCGLDLSAHDTGDGPAVFIILILGFIVIGLALWVEVTWTPPFWLHALLWGPLTVAGALAMLRPLKGVMVAQTYRHRGETFDERAAADPGRDDQGGGTGPAGGG